MTTPVTAKPIIVDTDITNGVIFRYFVKNTSTKRITEVDAVQYATFEGNPYYQTITVPWTIAGYDLNITTTDGQVIYGTIYKNTEVVRLYEKRMEGLSRILRNPSEYFYGKRYVPENET